MKPVFKPGDKVRLITDPRTVNRYWERWANQQDLTVGEWYTVENFFEYDGGVKSVRLSGKDYEWMAEFFEIIPA